MKIEEIMEIPRQLHDLRLIKVARNNKNAIENDWPTKKNYSFDNPELIKHLRSGGNYGAIAGNKHVLIDTDTQELEELVAKLIGERTFTVNSPGEGKRKHFYLQVDWLNEPPKTEPLDLNNQNVGHIQIGNRYLVGPGCTHPNGGKYTIQDDVPILEITEQRYKQIIEGLSPYIAEDAGEDEKAQLTEAKTKLGKFDWPQIVDLSKFRRIGTQYQGPHPIHGSSTGQNMTIDPDKGVWYCFRHASGGGPLHLIAVLNGFIKCEQSRRGVLRGELFTEVFTFAVDAGMLLPPEPEQLTHVNMIEDPKYTGQRVIVDAVISSNSTAYSAPAVFTYTYLKGEDENAQELTETIEIDEEDKINLEFVGVNSYRVFKAQLRLIPRQHRRKLVRIDPPIQSRAIYKVRVRPQVFTLEMREGKVFDETGQEYKSFDVYITSDGQLQLPPASVVRLHGIPYAEPRSQRITFLASKVSFPEDATNFNADKLTEIHKLLETKKTVKERLDWILDTFTCWAHMIERTNLAYANLLTMFSPLSVKLRGEEQRGWMNTAAVGDTTTGKSQMMRKTIQLFKTGMLITAETASIVGLTGTARQIENEWSVDWGFLVLNDQKLLCIDGAQKLTSGQWANLAESERSGVVTISKAAKGTAYARTRQIKLANPRDIESEKYSTKGLSAFLYPIQSLPTILDGTSIARLDLVVFADQRDVTATDIQNFECKLSPDQQQLLELLPDLLRWSWSRKGKAQFTEEAEKEVMSQFVTLHKKFFMPSIPLVSIDSWWKIARQAAALANLTCSTNEDFTTVNVTKDHVLEVVSRLETEYERVSLHVIAESEKYDTVTREDAEATIATVATSSTLLPEQVSRLFEWIAIESHVSKERIMEKFNLTERSQMRPLLTSLQNEHLVKAGRRGLYPTARLIEIVRLMKPTGACATFAMPQQEIPIQNTSK